LNVGLTHRWTVTETKIRDPAVRRRSGPPIPDAQAIVADFRARASEIEKRHRQQTLATVLALRDKYRVPVLGRAPV